MAAPRKPAEPRKPRVVGHGQLLKALDELPGITDARHRVATRYLAHVRPPDLTAYVKTATIAAKVGRSCKHVQRCRAWLLREGAIRIGGGKGGRGLSPLIDFTPLAERINRDSMASGFSESKTRTGKAETRTDETETRTEIDAVMIRTPTEGPLHKDPLRGAGRPPAKAGAPAPVPICETGARENGRDDGAPDPALSVERNEEKTPTDAAQVFGTAEPEATAEPEEPRRYGSAVPLGTPLENIKTKLNAARPKAATAVNDQEVKP